LLHNTSSISETLTCKASILKPLALMGITSTEDLETIYGFMDEAEEKE
jgi:hypothetical protein